MKKVERNKGERLLLMSELELAEKKERGDTIDDTVSRIHSLSFGLVKSSLVKSGLSVSLWLSSQSSICFAAAVAAADRNHREFLGGKKALRQSCQLTRRAEEITAAAEKFGRWTLRKGVRRRKAYFFCLWLAG